MSHQIPCSFCNQKSNNTESLKFHFQNYRGINIAETLKDRFICKLDNCPKKFSRAKSLFDHMNTKHLLDQASSLQNRTQDTFNTTATWKPSSINYDSFISVLVANMRQSHSVNGADVGRFVKNSQGMFLN